MLSLVCISRSYEVSFTTSFSVAMEEGRVIGDVEEKKIRSAQPKHYINVLLMDIIMSVLIFFVKDTNICIIKYYVTNIIRGKDFFSFVYEKFLSLLLYRLLLLQNRTKYVQLGSSSFLKVR